MPKGTPTTLTHTGTVSNTTQRTRNVTSIPIRTDVNRQNRPNSRGTPSRASNNSRGARASEDRTGRSFDDTDDHIHWLSIPAIEGDAQSFQSVTLDSTQQQEMANLIERQRINAKRATKDKLTKATSHSEHDLHTPLHLERQVTASTEGLSDITFESDDGFGSDRTTTAFYMSEKGSPTKENVAVRLRNMTDDEIAYLENYIRVEKQRRYQQHVDIHAVEARKQIRRSKSGGSEAAFSRKHTSSPGNGLERKGSGDLNSSFTSMRLQTGEAQEPEDPEVRSLFSTPEIPAAVLISQPSPYAVRVSSSSRGSGALHPGEKMFDPKLYVNGSTPSPATTNAASNSHANSAIHFNSPTQQLQSPVQESYHSSRPGSRPASGGFANMLHIQPVEVRINSNEHPTPPASKPMNVNNLPASTVGTAFSSIERSEETVKTKKLSGHHRATASREFVFSPSCAFDDISLGSQKSINSSRSSRTRVLGEGGIELSPGSTFSKHHNSVPLEGNLKKTVQSGSAMSESAKKSKKI